MNADAVHRSIRVIPTGNSGNIKIASLPNLRDIGGWQTRDGARVRTGLLYRSTELDKLHGEDMGTFAKLGIRSVYDLRTEAERSAQPDRLPPNTEYIVLDVLKDLSGAAPAQVLMALSDPKIAAEMLGGGKAVAHFEEAAILNMALPCVAQAAKNPS
ncbi:MAG: tyrosine-protein phosphatase [Chloroflexi bacterium]|nr:tyrosine-protein phosphatase [Chloroflexota bacterium]